MKPVWLRPCLNAATFAANFSCDAPCSNPTTGMAGCCARAASGHPAAAPPRNVMNSRRLTGRPLNQRVLPYHAVGYIVHHGKFWVPMSALGQKRTLAHIHVMSALPPIADIGTQSRDVRFVPKADIASHSLLR